METQIIELTLFDDIGPAHPDMREGDDVPVRAPLLLTIPQAAQLLGLGRTTIYGLIGDGRLEVVHVGRSARVPLAAVEGFVDELRRTQT